MAELIDHIQFVRVLARDFDGSIKGDDEYLMLPMADWERLFQRYTYNDNGINKVSLLDVAIEYCAIRAGYYMPENKLTAQMSLKTRKGLQVARSYNPDAHIWESKVTPFEG